MSTDLRDLLTQHADQHSPDLDIGHLVVLGERSLRRRRQVAALGSMLAVVLSIALAIGLGSLGAGDRAGDPIDRPSPEEPLGGAVRAIVYGDGLDGRTIHYGDQVVRTGRSVLHMAVTDDGVVYTRAQSSVRNDVIERENQVWFSDGAVLEQIGAEACGGHLSDRQVFSGTSGSLVAWMDCSGDGRETVVVYDTSRTSSGMRRGIVAHVPSGCAAESSDGTQFCALRGLVGDRVYWTRALPRGDTEELGYDLSADRRSTMTQSEYLLDLRSQVRGLVVGDTWAGGTPTDGIGQVFTAVGSRLVPQRVEGDGGFVETSAFDTSGRAVHLALPSGYRLRDAATLQLFEWLDDDTVALGVGVNGGGDDRLVHGGDLLRCRVSTGRCEVAVPGAGVLRVVPNLGLPG